MRKMTSSLLLAGAALLVVAGCAGPERRESGYQPPTRSDVSSIPWNRPESWEGQSIPGMPGTFGTR